MTQPTGSAQTAVDQLKQLLTDRMNQGVGAATTLAGQQAGVMAQAVRQAGEQMRQQGQENQGKVADRVAQPMQRLSATLSQFKPETLNLDPKQIRPQLTSQTQKAKTKAGELVSSQVAARAGQAGEAVTALTAGVGVTGEQLRAQGQEVPALIMDALVEKVEPLSDYLNSADLTKVRSDLAAKGRQAKVRPSSATGAVTRTQKTASAKSIQVVKQTASGFRQSPVLPAVGALAVAVALAARKGVKAGSVPTTAPAPAPIQVDGGTTSAGPEAGVTPASHLDGLSRSQLQDRAVAAGISVNPDMTKGQLRDLLLGT